MTTPRALPADNLLDFIRRVATAPVTRSVLAWLVVLALAVIRYESTTNMFNKFTPVPDESDPRFEAIRSTNRADGNNGHTHIDFGGQWVFARTLMTGHGRQLYHRQVHWEVANAGYPVERQSPAAQKYHWPGTKVPEGIKSEDARRDVDYLLSTMIGGDEDVKRADAVSEPIAIELAMLGTHNPFGAAALQVMGGPRFTEARVAEFAKPVIGGPLYPPTHPFFYAPLGLIPNPQLAYFVFQIATIVACFGCGWAIRVITHGRIWCSVATFAVLLYPGCQPGTDLGQNHCFTLLILLSGWALAVRGHPFAGGGVWGLLAFKPIWGLAFILAPILMRRWRFVLGTAVVGISYVLFTLPFVGVESWLNWLHVGRQAAELYNIDQNWIYLSRDLAGIAKRLLLDFPETGPKPDPTLSNHVALCFLATVLVLTVGLYVYEGIAARLWTLAAGLGCVSFFAIERVVLFLNPGWHVVANVLHLTLLLQGFQALTFFAFLMTTALCCFEKAPRRTTGLAAGFLLFGSYLCGYRFMYYDGLLAIVGFVAVLANPRGTFTGWHGTLRRDTNQPVKVFVNSPILTILFLLLLSSTLMLWWNPQITVALGNLTTVRKKDGKDVLEPRKLHAAADWNNPTDTLLVLAAWGWCGLRLLAAGRNPDSDQQDAPRSRSNAEPMSGERMSDSPTSTA